MMKPNDILQTAKDALAKAIEQKRTNQELIKSLGPAVIDALKPVLEEIAKNSKIPKEEVLNAISKIRIPEIKVPEPNISVNVPNIHIPEIKVPKAEFHFDASKIRIPDLKMPDEMNINGWVNLMGYDRGMLLNPLPVQLRDAKGNPLNLFENLSRILSGNSGTGFLTQPLNNGGGKADFLTIKGFMQSAFSEIMNADGQVKVSLPNGVSGLTDTELRAAHLDVQQLSGSIDSVKVTGFDTSVSAALIDSSGIQYSGSNPLPVTIISDAINLDQTTDSIAVRQVSGFADSVVVNSFLSSVAASLVDSSGVGYSGSNPLPITGPVVVSSITNSIAAALVDSSGIGYSGSNPLPVTLSSETIVLDQTTDSIAVRQVSGFTDSVFVVGPIAQGDSATALRIIQAGDSVSSVYANNPVAQGDAATAMRVVIAGNSDASVVVNSMPAVVVTSITNTVAAAIVDSSGVEYSGSNPIPVNLVSQSLASSASALVDSSGVQYSGANPVPVVIAAGSNNSVAASIIDSTGIPYETANPLPVTIISGALTSSIAVGPSASGVADDGSAPLQQGGIARTANPTAVSGGQVVKAAFDKLGRQLVRPLQVRDLIQTAYATLTNGTETTLKASPASTFLDLVYILGANNSDAAVIVDIRAGTANGVVASITVPPNGTAGVSLSVPIPQDTAAATWTADMPDITGTTVYLSALFSQEI